MNKDELKAFVTGMATGGELVVNGVFGGTEMMEQTVLWEGVQKPASQPTNIKLSDGINNYDAVIVSSWTYYNSPTSYDECNYILIPSCDYMLRSAGGAINRTFGIFVYYDNRYRFVQFGFLDYTTLVLEGEANIKTQSALRKVIGLKFTSRINYSTEEQCIGTYLDKPYYQKTILLDKLSIHDSEYVEEVVGSISEIVDINGQLWIGDNWIPLNSWTSTNHFSRCYTSGNTIDIFVSGWTASKARINIRYTKTTD